MIRIPLYLFVAQWALLGALGVLLVLAFRQIGRLLAGDARSAALGPPVGSRAAALAYARPGDDAARRLEPGDGTPLLIAFVDPTCPSCEELVRVLDAARADGDLAGVRVLALVSDPLSYLQISEAFSATGLEVGRPVRPDGLDSYQVSGTPLLVAVDGTGIVRAAGSVIAPAEVLVFARSCLLPVPQAGLGIVHQAVARGEGAT